MIALAVIYCIGALYTALDFAIDHPKETRASAAAAAGTVIAVLWPLSWGVILVMRLFVAREKA